MMGGNLVASYWIDEIARTPALLVLRDWKREEHDEEELHPISAFP
jgi:hypothetical protein